MTRPIDDSPLSEFVQKMRAVFARRARATTIADKRAIEREMEELMRTYLGRSAWDAMADAEAARGAACSNVPRDTSSDRRCHGKDAQSIHGGVDRKLASAGRDAD